MKCKCQQHQVPECCRRYLADAQGNEVHTPGACYQKVPGSLDVVPISIQVATWDAVTTLSVHERVQESISSGSTLQHVHTQEAHVSGAFVPPAPAQAELFPDRWRNYSYFTVPEGK